MTIRCSFLAAAALTFLLLVSPAVARSEALPERIISLAPTITETVFALGAESKLVAVTSYCKFPPEAQDLPKIGGLFDTSLETVVALKPDLVMMLDGHAGLKHKLTGLGIRVLSVHNESIDQIYDSILRIGEAVGAQTKAREMVKQKKSDLAAVLSKVKPAPSLRILVVIYANTSDAVTSAHVAGANTFYDDVLNTIGVSNAAAKLKGYPTVSAEGLAEIDPDIIIDISLTDSPVHRARLQASWRRLSFLRSVRDHHVFLLRRDKSSFPGPRFVETIRVISSVTRNVNDNEKNN